jgi:hypothetical protein
MKEIGIYQALFIMNEQSAQVLLGIIWGDQLWILYRSFIQWQIVVDTSSRRVSIPMKKKEKMIVFVIERGE